MKRALLILLATLAGAPAQASETDQYFAWGRPLADSTARLNGHVNYVFDHVLTALNADADRELGCTAVAEKLYGKMKEQALLMEFFPHRAVILPMMPGAKAEVKEFDRVSYLGFPEGLFNVTLWVPASPTIEAGGIRFGIDKLQHFFSTGWRCFLRYWDERRKGASEEGGYAEAMDYALETERTNLGMKASRVFSYADMQANFQGVRFYAGLCEGSNARLQGDGEGHWKLVRPFDIREFVSPAWDESFNSSWFVASRWGYVRPRLPRYCKKLNLPVVIAQKARYRAIEAERNRDPDYVTRFLRAKVAAGQTPDPWFHSLEKVCGRSVKSFSGFTATRR